jgi:dTDP-4-dehydrorhamnose reductase
VRVLVTGAAGQLGRALLAAAPAPAVVRAVTHAELDIADEAAVEAALRSFAPQLLINAGAFTRVDDAERAPQEAARANSGGPGVLAGACARSGTWLTHVSTDFVFDGRQGRPYDTEAATNPLSVYGRTKLEGEASVRRALPEHSSIVRASWLYSAQGGFLARMLTLMQSRRELSIVADQVSAPTHAAGLARVLWELSARRAAGLWHWCDSGVASWYDFAVAIAEEALAHGLLASAPAIAAIGSAEYPTPATRPAYSLLDKRRTEKLLGFAAPHWRHAVRDTLATLRARPAAPPSEAAGARR